MDDDLFRLRMASQVFTWPVRPSAFWKPPRCRLCRLPIYRDSAVVEVEGVGYSHPFCADEHP